MAVVQTKSATITNRDAVPAVINDGRLERSTLETGVGSVAVGAADSIGSYYPLVSVPSSAMIRGILATCVAGMTTTAGTVGVYKNTVNSAGLTTGVVANTGSGTFFAATQTFAAALNRSDVTNAAGTYTTLLREQPLWQAIGLTTDPNTTFDIGIVLTTANTGAAGRIGLEVHYVDNSA